MKILTAQMTREAEERSVALGMEWIRLMENAGSAVFAAIRRQFDLTAEKFCVVCGSGGNGGDGFVTARKLRESGAAVSVVLSSGMPKTADAIENYRRAVSLGVRIYDYTASAPDCLTLLRNSTVIVDAIFGIGFHGVPEGNEKFLIEQINRLKAPIVSIDLPSGADCDGAAIPGACIRAALTVTFGALKPCHVFAPASACCGKVSCVPIGMPEAAFDGLDTVMETIDRRDVAAVCAPRRADAHKGDFGFPLLICGSYGMAGAAAMAAKAALRCGSGIVTLAVPKSIYEILAAGIYEPVFVPLDQTGDGKISFYALPVIEEHLKKATALLIGPGLGGGADVGRVVSEVVKSAACPMIIDADGINALCGRIDIIKNARAAVVLTPHPGEMARLLGKTAGEVQADRVGAARLAAQQTGAVVVLKGSGTIIAEPDGKTYINLTGNPGMASGGSGDVLSGMIAAFLGRGFGAVQAAKAAVYFHGAAGDIAAKELTQTAMLPTDLIDKLPIVFQ